MFMKFDGRLINPNALSELVSVKQDDAYKIMAFRLDGSFMASETFSDASKAVERFNEIEGELISYQGVYVTNDYLRVYEGNN